MMKTGLDSPLREAMRLMRAGDVGARMGGPAEIPADPMPTREAPMRRARWCGFSFNTGDARRRPC